MKKNKIIILLSVCLNLALVSFFILIYVKGATIQDVQGKVISTITGQENKSEYSWYYLGKESQFFDLSIDSNSVVFVGDSITDMGEWAEIFGSTDYKNRGIQGDNIKGVNDRIDNIAKQIPAKIFLLVGTNDLTNNTFDNGLIENYRNIIKNIKKASPETDIYVQSVLPVNDSFWVMGGISELAGRKQTNEVTVEFNKELKSISEQEDVTYINLFDSFTNEDGNLKESLTIDGLHLSGEGYSLWKDSIKEFINE